jgi:hypothetical protein
LHLRISKKKCIKNLIIFRVRPLTNFLQGKATYLLTKYRVYDTLYYDKIIQVTLSREVEGMGPMKPGNRQKLYRCQFLQDVKVLTDEDKNGILFL